MYLDGDGRSPRCGKEWLKLFLQAPLSYVPIRRHPDLLRANGRRETRG